MAYEYTLDALGDPMRRQIFDRLRSAPNSVVALAEGLPISRPAVSQHLKILKQAGLVTDQARGTRRVYRVDHGGLSELRAWLDGFWEEARGVYEAEIQEQIDERKNT
ncbi:MAG TPA: metalloregulator ArsR/SmtB family transcription factor [Rhizomicrobium sp.]|jgi:DNA-binding transcriptional ArsR family regulator|nr:metalloregulator ArsR/SmtB family transcription factor [Rhizomicrobium sp.]